MSAVDDEYDDLDAAMASKKRGRELALASLAADQDEDDKNKNRGNYKCSRCNLPKKGHVCPFQPRFKKRDQVNEVGSAPVADVGIQTELDTNMTLRVLGNLALQGTQESYLAGLNSHKISQRGLNEAFQNVAVDR